MGNMKNRNWVFFVKEWGNVFCFENRISYDSFLLKGNFVMGLFNFVVLLLCDGRCLLLGS